MKPSEFISKTNAEKLNGLEEDDGEAKFLELLKELDSRFIDKEELRNKILRKFDYYEDNCDSWDTNLVYLEIKEEILGMLK